MDLTTMITVLCLLFTTFKQSSAREILNPTCNAKKDAYQGKEKMFVFYIDRTEPEEILLRILYIIKGMSCEIPINDNLLSIILEESSFESDVSSPMTSDKLVEKMVGSEMEEAKDLDVSHNRCTRFSRALSKFKSMSNRPNVQFIIPIIDQDPGCNILSIFQNRFKDDKNKESIYFNGILINSTKTEDNQQAVKVIVRDLKDINLLEPQFSSASYVDNIIGDLPPTAQIVQMTNTILGAGLPRDWEIGYVPPTIFDITTTSVPRATDSTPMTYTQSTSKDIESTTESATILVSESSTLAVPEPSTSAVPESSTSDEYTIEKSSTVQPSSTTNSTTSTTELLSKSTTSSKKRLVMEPLNLIIERSLNGTEAVTNETATTTKKLEVLVETTMNQEDPGSSTTMATGLSRLVSVFDDIWIYILLLVILIILFLIVICCCCCCGKKENEDENNNAVGASKPLVHKQKPKKSSTSKSSSKSASAESDEELKNIKPGSFKVVDEEARPVSDKPASYEPLEVSDYETKEPNDQFSEKPRHGYQPSKPPPAFHFE